MKFFIIILLFFILNSCRSAENKAVVSACPSWNGENLVYAAKSGAEESMKADSAAQKIRLAKKGVDWSGKCIDSFPESAGCYFYRAVNTGLYYEAVVVGYQKGLKAMLADLNRVIELEESYEAGGAYRILGYIYLKAPAFSLHRKAVTRDVGKAAEYARKALAIDPFDIENRLLFAEVLVEKNRPDEAYPMLKVLAKNLEGARLSAQQAKMSKTVRKLLEKMEGK